jgi:acetyltransferase-like isoleucine patch superfamily enzyme
MRNIYKKILKFLFSISPLLNLRIFLLRLAGYKIGRNVYIPGDLKISDMSSRQNHLLIQDRVSIGPGVILITDSGPNNSHLINIFPLKSGRIVIENDAWIGAGAIIMPDVRIGECTVIGAGSVVTKDIPPFSVAIGLPAKVTKEIDRNAIKISPQV